MRALIIDSDRLVAIPLNDGLGERVYAAALDASDPPVARGGFIYLRRSDCAACGPARPGTAPALPGPRSALSPGS